MIEILVSVANHQLAYTTPEKLLGPDGYKHMTFTSIDMSSLGYTKLGTARVELSLLGHTEILDNAIASLRKEQEGLRAEATAKCTLLENKIQQMLAIENKPAASPQTAPEDPALFGDFP